MAGGLGVRPKKRVKHSSATASDSAAGGDGKGSVEVATRGRSLTQRKTPARAGSSSRGPRVYRSLSRPPEVKTRSYFLGTLWWAFCIENWVLDFGRPIAMDMVPTSLAPLSLPSVGDIFHMAYNVATPFLLAKLIDNSPRQCPKELKYLLIIVMVMGASMHLVADSVNHRLRHVGYQNHLSVRENPVIANLRPTEFIDFFELLYFYDERLGHLLWYIPWFGACVACVWGETFGFSLGGVGNQASKGDDDDDDNDGENLADAANLDISAPLPSTVREPLPAHAALFCLPLSGAYLWYLGTEGQISQLVVASWIAMELLSAKSRGVGVNGRFLTWTFRVAVALTALWCTWLWNDVDLRTRYPSVWYVPEPYTWHSLYTARHATV